MNRKKEINTSKIRNEQKYEYSKKIHISYGLGAFVDTFLTTAFVVRVINYYEDEIVPLISTPGEIWIATALIGLAFVIYGLWNMINDPLIGYLTDKKYNFIKKWGRRYPWYLVGIFSYAWIYLLIFIIPFKGLWGMFFWLLFTISLFEIFYTLWQVNYLAIFPEKFRTQEERTKVGLWTTIWGATGIVFGVLIPSIIVEYGNLLSYLISGVVLCIIGVIIATLTIPGMKEDDQLIQREIDMIEEEEKKGEKASFLDLIKISLKNKNFVAYTMTYFGDQVLSLFLLGSLAYWIKYIIGSGDAELETIISLSFLLASLISAPMWEKIGNKVGNRKTFMYGALLTTIFLIPFMFISDLLGTVIVGIFVGVAVGAIWVLTYPCFSDVIDDIVVKTGEKKEGMFTGIRTFFARAPLILQGVLFPLIHILTNYKAGAMPGKNTQPFLAQIGIRIQMIIIPMIFYFIGFILMWKVYDLTQERVAENREALLKKGIQ